MIVLHRDAEQLLREIVAAGSRGLAGEELADRKGDVAALANEQLIDVGPDRSVTATARGKAYRERTVA